MRLLRRIPSLLTLALVAGAARAEGYPVVQQWRDPTFSGPEFKKLLVVGITGDQPVRHRFEDKFVSHLRARIDGVTSHSLVPDLATIEDPAAVALELASQQVDGAITVSLVPLADGEAEQSWPGIWLEGRREEITFRAALERALPKAGVEAGRYGLEIDLWDAAAGRIWSGRTDPQSIKSLRKGAGEFVRSAVVELRGQGLLP